MYDWTAIFISYSQKSACMAHSIQGQSAIRDEDRWLGHVISLESAVVGVLGINSREMVFKEAVLGRDVIVPAFPPFSRYRGLHAQYTSGHLAWPEDPACSVGQEDVLSLEV